jgi:hypothetical protein
MYSIDFVLVLVVFEWYGFCNSVVCIRRNRKLLKLTLVTFCSHDAPVTRDENGRNFFRTVPFCFLHFFIHFRICEIPFSYLRK